MKRFDCGLALLETALLISALPLLTTGAGHAAETSGESQKVRAVDPRALEALNKMGAYLRTLSSFEVAMDTTTDAELEDGQKVQLTGVTDYKVKRPNEVLVAMSSDRKVRDIYYDGKSLTVYSPRMHYYATVPAPATIKETLDAAYDKYGVELPLEDLFRWGTPEDKHKELKSGTLVGYAKIDGKDADQYAFRQGDVDWQIWIERGDKPLPIKAVVTTTSDPAKPEFSAVMHWTPQEAFSDASFKFKPPAGAMPIAIVSSNP
jgi:hypothetical protein